MDDLISRKAALELLGEPHTLDYNAISYAHKIISLPSVPAVSLNKLCECIALHFGYPCEYIYPCEFINDCNGWYPSDCVTHDGNKVACWEKVLTKWMEDNKNAARSE